jgi:hypothetical protein
MVRRLSLPSLDSGAESPVYVGEPSAPAARRAHVGGDVPPCGASTCGFATVVWISARQVMTRRAAPRRKLRHVGHRPAKRKMVCKGHPRINAADGNPMTWSAPSWSYLAPGSLIANSLMSGEEGKLNSRYLC